MTDKVAYAMYSFLWYYIKDYMINSFVGYLTTLSQQRPMTWEDPHEW